MGEGANIELVNIYVLSPHQSTSDQNKINRSDNVVFLSISLSSIRPQ